MSLTTIYRSFLLIMAFMVVSAPSRAHELVGYTLIAEKTVQGEFEGCEISKRIRFMDGTSFGCSTFYYTYSFMPTASIYAKPFKYEGKEFVSIKMVVLGVVYDMLPIRLD